MTLSRGIGWTLHPGVQNKGAAVRASGSRQTTCDRGPVHPEWMTDSKSAM